MSAELVHRLDQPLPEDREDARARLGLKGVGLVEMRARGLPVPDGFILSTALCREVRAADGALPDSLGAVLREQVAALETRIGRKLGEGPEPLLLSVRGGAPFSMPGMLETVLDLGVREEALSALAANVGGPRFALDTRRRFLLSYATAVLGVPRDAFGALLRGRELGALTDDELSQLLFEFERSVTREAGASVPVDPFEQILGAVGAVIASFDLPRAQKYREAHGLADDAGTAVVVQAMVYGNLGERSGAGVAFSRHPSSGAKTTFGEWIAAGQGSDVMAGRRTPAPLTEAQVRRGTQVTSFEAAMPDTLAELRGHLETLEALFEDAVQVEFTVERGVLYLLQGRTAKRTAAAAARIAVELHEEGRLSRARALQRIEPASLRQLLTPRVPDPQDLVALGIAPIARGLAASPGAATGAMVLDEAGLERHRGEDVVLVRAETSADDVATMRAAGGVLTAAGGLTCHAAVVARAMGKPCIVGASAVEVDLVARRVRVLDTVEGRGAIEFAEGDVLTIDGARGLVYPDAIPVEPAPASEHVERLLSWADDARTIEVWAEASNPRLAAVAARYGADRVLLARGVDVEAALAAVGEVGLVVRPDSPLEGLRPDRDRVLGAPPQGASLEGIAEDAIAVGDAVSVSLETPGRIAVVVAPLDIPIARLRAACLPSPVTPS